MKLCKKCNTEKDLSCFAKKKNSKSGLQSYCKECANSGSKNWYKDNIHNEKTKERLYSYSHTKEKELRDIVNGIKGISGCCLCEEKDPNCLDFHHIGEKLADISYLTKTKNKKKVLEEIDKCLVLCANCHRKLHNGSLCLIINKPIGPLA